MKERTYKWVRLCDRLEWLDVGEVFLVREIVSNHNGYGVGLTTIPKCTVSINIYLEAGGEDINEKEY